MHGRRIVRDISIVETTLWAVEWVRRDLRGSVDQKKRLLYWVEVQPPVRRARYRALIKRLRQGKVRTASAVGILFPEAIGVFPGVGEVY